MSEQSSAQLVVFALADERYALPINRVREIIRYTEPRSVHSTEHGVRGVLSLRGQIVPVYDLAERLGIHAEHGEDNKIVIVETGSETAGVIVDAVEEVLTIDHDRIEAVPGADTNTIESITEIEGRLVVLLNSGTLFHDLLLARG
jgi:purine-binding chemotaxis protein CheW